MEMERKRIAVVGSGISGLSALWTLRNTPHEVHLYEAAERLGGHTNTVTWKHDGHSTPVDTGFIVMNTATYPNFIAFLQALQVKTISSQMTFGISRDQGAFEWSGTSGATLFAQPINALRPSFWRMIFDIVRFNLFSLDLLSQPFSSSSPSSASAESSSLSVGEYLAREGYSSAFRDDYLIPMTACVWSTGADKCALDFPVLTLVRFMWNHHLLSTVAERPPWLTIEGGSRRYIDAVLKDCGASKIHLSTPVESLTRKNGLVDLRLGGLEEGKAEAFDEVVLACHGDQARAIVGDAATLEERQILGAFETTPNTAYLHSDLSLMPRRRAAWSAWNYLTTSQPQTSSALAPKNPSLPSNSLQTVSLTYDMNVLQSLAPEIYSDVLVTLNPETPPDPALTQAVYEYRHPLYNARMVAAQDELEKIQGKRGVWYAGAWTGYGFHEDGFASGMGVGLRLGGEVPWEVKSAKFSRGAYPVLEWKDVVARLVVRILQVYVSILDRVLGLRMHLTRRDPKAIFSLQEPVNGHGRANGKVKAA